MPQIIPIRDLKNTSFISERCKELKEPMFVTKNGYGDMVIMSMETYEKSMFMNDIFEKLAAAEDDLKKGKVMSADDSLSALKKKHEL